MVMYKINVPDDKLSLIVVMSSVSYKQESSQLWPLGC